MGREAWQAVVHRVTKSHTQLKQLSMYPLRDPLMLPLQENNPAVLM